MKKAKKIILALFMLVLSLQFTGINQVSARVVLPPPPPTEPLEFVGTQSDFSCDSEDLISLTWSAASGYNSRSSKLYRSYDQSTWTLIGSKGTWLDAHAITYSTTAPTVSNDQVKDVYYKIKVTDSSGSIYDIAKVTVYGPPTPLQIISPLYSSIEHNYGDTISLQWTAKSGYPTCRSSHLYQKFGQTWAEISSKGSWTNNAPITYTIDTTTLDHTRVYTVYYRFDIHDSSGVLYDQFSVNYFWDDDQDGMPNFWEDANNLLSNNPADAGEDPDGDLLTNLDEYHHNTNPHNNDTDNDGLTDYDELYTYNTDPLNNDSDGDWILDGNEINEANTDPNEFDYPDCNFGNFENHSLYPIGSAPYNMFLDSLPDEITISSDPNNSDGNRVLDLTYTSESQLNTEPSAEIPIDSGNDDVDVYFSFKGGIFGMFNNEIFGQTILFGGPNCIDFQFYFYKDVADDNPGLYLRTAFSEFPPDESERIKNIELNRFYLIETLISYDEFDMEYTYKVWVNNINVITQTKTPDDANNAVLNFQNTYFGFSANNRESHFYVDDITVSEARKDPAIINAIENDLPLKDYILGGSPVVDKVYEAFKDDIIENILNSVLLSSGEISLGDRFSLEFYLEINPDLDAIVIEFTFKIPTGYGDVDFFIRGTIKIYYNDLYIFDHLTMNIAAGVCNELEISKYLTIGCEAGVKSDDNVLFICRFYVLAYLEIEWNDISFTGTIETGVIFKTDISFEGYTESQLKISGE
ncbi:MAG: hypothetical protein ACTSW5_02905 [Promethearchaeota archaeon]